MDITVSFTLNGKEQTITTDADRSLLDVLREDFHLTGAKYGCGEGVCGACTVIVDGKPAHSCVTPISKVEKSTVRTIEGLAKGDSLHPIQQAFLDEGAMQCGYCTSGMIMSAAALLENNPNPTDDEIITAMDGNICRCNGYVKILKAVRRAAERTRR